MAHNIQLPIAFEFRPLQASWSTIAAKITGWAPLKSPESNRCFLARVEVRGTPYLLEIPWWGLPKPALTLFFEKSSELPDVRSYPAELLVCRPSPSHGGTEKRREADPWSMRTEFLQLKPNTEELVAFLNKWGVWGQTRLGSPEATHIPHTGRIRSGLPLSAFDSEKLPDLFDPYRSTSLPYLSPADLWSFWQECRKTLSPARGPAKALTGPAYDWLTRFQKLLPLTPRPEYPHWLLSANNCQEAIRTTITLDLLKKVKFRLCARPDCRSPFPVESHHQRQYCRQYCAHIESVRRQRRTAKQEALQQARKELSHASR